MSILSAVVVPHPPIILPEIGRGEEIKISATSSAYKEISKRIVEKNPETIIITSPHSIMYADYFHISPGNFATGNFSQFRAPQVSLKINYDEEFVKNLSDAAMQENISAGILGEKNSELDHGTMIPLRFLELAGLDFDKVKFLRIGLSGLSAAEHYKFGKIISKISEKLNRRTIFIASGDLSHKLKESGPYGFAEEGPQFDKEVMKNLSSGEFLKLLTMDKKICNRAAECGLRSFWIMSGALDEKKIFAEKLSYEGTFGVGYGIIYFEILGEDKDRNFLQKLLELQHEKYLERKKTEDEYIKLARYSVENFVKNHKAELPENLPEKMLNQRAGAFVSLHKNGELRGCIGTIAATRKNIAEEILQNGISACSRDPRFSPVEVSELEEIIYSVDILGEPERIFEKKDLDIKKYGVIVENNGRRGLLLPDLEGIETIEQQILIAKQKANIGAKEPINLWRFEVIRHQ